MFQSVTTFNGDISKWDVSRVTDMSGMFFETESFNGDISKWDVSSVTDMNAMFFDAQAFNGDISKWDVSKVTNMDYMFRGAMLFTRNLCGAAWIDSKASQNDMFADSSGSISRSVCTATTLAPLSERQLIV